MKEFERLTERDKFGNTDIIGVDTNSLIGNLTVEQGVKTSEALDRLAGFEDMIENIELVSVDSIATILEDIFDNPCNDELIDEYMNEECNDWCDPSVKCDTKQSCKCWKKYLQTRLKEILEKSVN